MNRLAGTRQALAGLVLAGAAAQWGAALTVRNAHLRSEDTLEEIAAAGRGHVTFDLAE